MKVTIDALLRLLAAAFVEKGDEYGEKLPTPGSYRSDCKRFEINRHQLNKDNTPLFVQQRTDYFQRLELFIDTKLVAAYHEPVWPHLQDPNALRSTHLDLPIACMKFLEQRAAKARGPHPSLTSSNQEYHAIDGDSVAAA